MRLLKLGTIFFLIASGLSSCASSAINRRLDEKVARQTDVSSRKDIDAKASTLLQSTAGLSERQRERINALKASLQTRLGELNTESRKLRSLLVEDVLSSDDRSEEIAELKSRLRKNSAARIDTIFRTVDQANDILGRNRILQQAMDLQMMEDGSAF